jgi:hypothetical protein
MRTERQKDDMQTHILIGPPKGLFGAEGDAQVQIALSNIAFELRIRKMNLSKEKCTVLVCSRDEVKEPPTLQIEGVALPVVDKQGYLSLTFNSRLDWTDHFASVIARANRVVQDIAANVTMRYPSWHMVLLLFRALALSVISYGMPVWQPSKMQSDWSEQSATD